MFKLQGSTEYRLEKATLFREALLALPSQIECLRGMEVGINVNPAEEWDIVLTATVDDMEALVAYACHPLHLEAAAIIKDCKAGRACVDYVI